MTFNECYPLLSYLLGSKPLQMGGFWGGSPQHCQCTEAIGERETYYLVLVTLSVLFYYSYLVCINSSKF